MSNPARILPEIDIKSRIRKDSTAWWEGNSNEREGLVKNYVKENSSIGQPNFRRI